MRRLLQLAVVAAAISTSLIAQSKPSPSPSSAPKPDFTGTWVFSRAEGGRGARGAFGLGLEFQATQTEKTLSVVGNTPLSGETKAVYALDGSVTQNGPGASKATWDGSKLVIASAGEGTVTRTQTWALDASGRLTIVTLLGPNQDQTQTVIYQKK